jgi:hypothetical protein
MGQLLTTAYKLIAPPVPLPQKIRDQIDFMLMFCPSKDLVKSLMDMAISVRMDTLKRVPENFEIFTHHEILIPVYFKSIQKELETRVASKNNLFENLTTRRNELYSSVTDEHIKTLKSDIKTYLLESFAQTYMFAVTALKALDPENTEWKAELRAIIDTQDGFLDDLDRHHILYQDELTDFNNKYKNNLELVASVTALIDYIDTVLPKPAVHSTRYRE